MLTEDASVYIRLVDVTNECGVHCPTSICGERVEVANNGLV